MEDKTGKIINVENSNEKQKNQKLWLKLKIAALCTAIGISGVGIVGSFHQNKNDNTISTEAETNTNTIIIQPNIKSLVPSLVVYQEETREVSIDENNDLHIISDWTKGNLLFTNGSSPKDDISKRYILVGTYSEEEVEQLLLFQEETRYVSIDENGNYQIESDWLKTNNYIICNVAPPVGSVDTRYIYLGTVKDIMNNNNIMTSVENERSK